MPHAVTWFDISSNDPDNLAAFYKKAFRWKIDPQQGNLIAPQKDGQQQGIAGSISPAQGGPGGVTVYVTCPDIDDQLAKLQKAGGTPLMPRVDLPNNMGSIATFSDPHGNTLGLWAPSKPSAGGNNKPAKKSAKKSAKKAAKKAAADQPAQAASKKASKKAAKKAPRKAGKKAPPPPPAEAPAQAAAPPPAKKAAKKKAAKKAPKKVSKKAPPPPPAEAPAQAAAPAPAKKKASKKKGKK